MKEDFHELHRKRPGHQGIIAVYRDADPHKNMNHAQIAAAIRRLETLQVTIAGDFHVLIPIGVFIISDAGTASSQSRKCSYMFEI
jgi:hypothetical protein